MKIRSYSEPACSRIAGRRGPMRSAARRLEGPVGRMSRWGTFSRLMIFSLHRNPFWSALAKPRFGCNPNRVCTLGRLKSPSVGEFAVGYGMQIGSSGYAKVDLIKRDWKNFYAGAVTPNTPKANTPLGVPVDLTLVTNSSDIKRTYRGVQFQGQWHPRRWNLGLNYTWSKLRGNDEGETAGSGHPIPIRRMR